MGESNNSGKKSNTAPLIATLIVVIAAIAAVITLIVISGNIGEQESSAPPSSSATVFRPTQEFIEECSIESNELLQNSYRIIRLFITEGLPHYDEPYGNEPEDGIYTVDSKEYTSLEQIEQFVKSVYVSSEAERILHNLDGNGFEVYKNREVFKDIVYTDEASAGESGESSDRPAYTKQTVLGINAEFKPDTSYEKSWESSRLEFVPISENECKLTIFLGADESTDLSAVDPASVLETSMVKQDGKWRLTKFVY